MVNFVEPTARPVGARAHRTDITLADGRELFYYDREPGRG
jgi:hypothetical protein